MIKGLSQNISNDEMLRIIDLTLRRVVDHGEENYSKQEQELFVKIRELKHKYGSKYGRFL